MYEIETCVRERKSIIEIGDNKLTVLDSVLRSNWRKINSSNMGFWILLCDIETPSPSPSADIQNMFWIGNDGRNNTGPEKGPTDKVQIFKSIDFFVIIGKGISSVLCTMI